LFSVRCRSRATVDRVCPISSNACQFLQVIGAESARRGFEAYRWNMSTGASALYRRDDALQQVLLRAELAAWIECQSGAGAGLVYPVQGLERAAPDPVQSGSSFTLQPGLHITLAGHHGLQSDGRTWSLAPTLFILVFHRIPVVPLAGAAEGQPPLPALRVLFTGRDFAYAMAKWRGRIPNGYLPLSQPYQARMTVDLLDAVLRLVRLGQEPAALDTLAPLVRAEILYRSLTAPSARDGTE